MKLLSPEGQALPPALSGARRPPRLDGLRIGLLDNTKAPVDKMMEHLGRRIAERLPGATVFSVSKKHPSMPAEQEVFDALRANADVVINALGD
jgi:hypothetical protein